MRVLKILVLCVFLTVPQVVQASTITVFNAFLDGSQANAGMGTGSAGVGSATMTLDQDTGLFSWFIAWQDLSTPVIAGHFHGPAPPGVNAGVVVPFDFGSNPSTGSATLTAGQATDLLAGLWYINVHTSMFGGGEIRGQVLPIVPVPLPAAFWLLGTALLGMVSVIRRN